MQATDPTHTVSARKWKNINGAQKKSILTVMHQGRTVEKKTRVKKLYSEIPIHKSKAALKDITDTILIRQAPETSNFNLLSLLFTTCLTTVTSTCPWAGVTMIQKSGFHKNSSIASTDCKKQSRTIHCQVFYSPSPPLLLLNLVFHRVQSLNHSCFFSTPEHVSQFPLLLHS